VILVILGKAARVSIFSYMLEGYWPGEKDTKGTRICNRTIKRRQTRRKGGKYEVNVKWGEGNKFNLGLDTTRISKGG